MKIPIDTFELHFSEISLVKGEKIFDENKVEAVNKVDKNLWISSIHDQRHLEVEVVLSPKFLKKATCECENFKQHQQCEHLVATLFWIRKHKARKTKVSPKTVRKQAYKTISLPLILNEMSRTELQDYVRTITRKNKHIANDIKLKYAYKVDHIKAKDKYKDILNAIFRPYVAKEKISITQIRHLFNLVIDLLDQATDFAALKQYEESLFAALSAYQKINYLYGKLHIDYKWKYKDIMIDSYKKMEYILNQDLAPKLRRTGLRSIEDLALSNYYQWVDIKYNFIHYLWENHWTQTRRQKVISELLPQIKSKFEGHQLILYDALGYFFGIRSNRLTEEQKSTLAVMEVPHFRDICKELYHHSPAYVDQLCLIALEIAQSSSLKKYAFGILSADELNTPSILDHTTSLYDLLVRTGDIQIARWLTKNDPAIQRRLGFVVERLYQKLPEDRAHRLSLEMYYLLGMYDDMVRLLSNHLNVNYFDIFAHNLWLEHPSEFTRICVDSLKVYLQNHIGNIALSNSTSLISFLENMHAYDVVSLLKEMIRQEFPHRKVLAGNS